MQKLEDFEMEQLCAAGGNCDGIYYSCVTAAALAGAAGVVATAGWGIVFSVAASGAAMEYCRQQSLGC